MPLRQLLRLKDTSVSGERGQPVATDGIELSLRVMSPRKHHSGFE